MPNDVKLQEGHPVDENLRPIKVGGKSTAIETAQHGNGARVNGDLEVNGGIKGGYLSNDLIMGANQHITTKSISADAGTLGIYNGSDVGIVLDPSDNASIKMNSVAGSGSDYFLLSTSANGVSYIQTVDAGGDAEGHLTIAPDGDLIVGASDITLESATGVFEMKKSGTKFADMYAGMMLGYTRISNDSTTTGHAEINPDATMTVLQTAQGTDVSVTFVAPPSGNVEISILCQVYANSRTLEFALSDNASFNEIAETHTYDAGAQSSDETDVNMTYVSFVNTGLTAGTEYERWIGAAETISGTSAIRHGRNRSTGAHYPPIIVKAIALPATITTGE